MGASPLTRLGPGQSFVELSFGPAALGYSAENVRWGRARRSPMMMGTTAEGFPHAFFELRGQDTPIGVIEIGALWGRLRESEFFSPDDGRDDNLMSGLAIAVRPSGLAIAVRPSGLPRLEIGLTSTLRTLTQGGLRLADYLAFFPTESGQDVLAARRIERHLFTSPGWIRKAGPAFFWSGDHRLHSRRRGPSVQTRACRFFRCRWAPPLET